MKLANGVWILFTKELKDSFGSPLLYILSGLFSLIMGWLFFNYLMLARNLSNLSLTESILAPTFGNINLIFLFIAPLLTMGSFAEEKKQNTIELLYQSQLSHFQMIFAKFLSSTVVVIFMLLLTLVFPVVLSMSGYNDWGVVITGYLGIICSVMCYLIVGVFASSLTSNLVISALTSFSILMGILLLILSAHASNNYLVGQMFQYLSFGIHYEGFSRGVIKSYDLIYYFSFIAFFFYLTRLTLDSRNW